MNRGRTSVLADGLTALLWVAQVRRPFTHDEFELGTGFARRTAYRWLSALRAVGAIEPVDTVTRKRRSRGVYTVGRFEGAVERLLARAAA